ncbi:MAG TPA: universal stress protein, partial [Gemmataceae bacterium]|nr:universal stress protein [Gemmataceae bacterium]
MNSGIATRVAVRRVRDVVDVTSEDSFPASDPPSWTPVVGTGTPCRVGRRAGVNARAARDETPVPSRAVLHPTDYSDASRCAFQIACRLTPGGRVTVLHVPEPPHVPFGMARPPPLPSGYRGAWESQLGLVRSPDPTVRVDHRLEEGDPATEILRVADDPAHDLIVMGAGRRGGLWWALTGSVSRAVARRARCPVVRVTVPEERSYPIAPRRVLLATDSREPDAYSLALAHALAVNADEELFVLSVRPAAGLGADGYGTAKHRPTAPIPGVRLLVREGSLVEEVLRATRDLRPAVLVMGTRGRTGIGELFDPARAIRRVAACPVLSVHLPARMGRAVVGWHRGVAT